jgi:predicted Rossmann-fold nucleotide-binding protein
MVDIHNVEEALQHPERFRVSIFGSAKIEKDSHEYQQVFNLTKALGAMGINIITGGGPGVMEAGNSGLEVGTDGDAKSVGLTIEVPCCLSGCWSQ